MKKLGICSKCGQEKTVRDHHVKGYGEGNKDYTLPYCYSCDRKAHFKTKREGKCNLSPDETFKLTRNSYHRRVDKHFSLSSNAIMTNVQLKEKLKINLNTGTITISSYFQAGKHKKLKYI